MEATQWARVVGFGFALDFRRRRRVQFKEAQLHDYAATEQKQH